jgi:hypothetical protein
MSSMALGVNWLFSTVFHSQIHGAGALESGFLLNLRDNWDENEEASMRGIRMGLF